MMSSLALYPTGKTSTDDKFFSFKPKTSSYFSGIKPYIGQESIFSFAQTVNRFPNAR